jgi:hypothetical protein
VDGTLILAGRPEIETALGLGDDAKGRVVSKRELQVGISLRDKTG